MQLTMIRKISFIHLCIKIVKVKLFNFTTKKENTTSDNFIKYVAVGEKRYWKEKLKKKENYLSFSRKTSHFKIIKTEKQIFLWENSMQQIN